MLDAVPCAYDTYYVLSLDFSPNAGETVSNVVMASASDGCFFISSPSGIHQLNYGICPTGTYIVDIEFDVDSVQTLNKQLTITCVAYTTSPSL